MFALLFTAVALLVAIIAAVTVLRIHRRDAGESGPRCGGCGYNLTACLSNRCPECGRLFIEAGVVVRQTGAVRRRWPLGLAAGSLGVLLFSAGLSMTLWLRAERAAAVAQQARAQAAAGAAQAAKVAAFQQSILEATTPAQRLQVLQTILQYEQGILNRKDEGSSLKLPKPTENFWRAFMPPPARGPTTSASAAGATSKPQTDRP